MVVGRADKDFFSVVTAGWTRMHQQGGKPFSLSGLAMLAKKDKQG
jgi:hypothetical protein